MDLPIKAGDSLQSDKKGKKQATAMDNKGRYKTFQNRGWMAINSPKCPKLKNKNNSISVPKRKNKYFVFPQNEVQFK